MIRGARSIAARIGAVSQRLGANAQKNRARERVRVYFTSASERDCAFFAASSSHALSASA